MKKNLNIQRHLAEQSILFASITKWIILSSLIGVLIGTVVSLFLKLLEYCENSRTLLPFDYYYTFPFALVLTVYMVKKIAPSAQGHGTEKVIEAVHKNSAKIDLKVVPVKLFATILTIFSGGSVGKEGPGAQIGAALSSFISMKLNFTKRDRKKIVICGISAGFASVFGTPLAGAIFGVEILIVGTLMYDILLPSIVAGFSAFFVAKIIGINYSYFYIAFFSNLDFNYILISKVILGGIFFGLVSDFVITTLKVIHNYVNSININYLLKAFLGGLLVVALTIVIGEDYLGLGFQTIKDALSTDELIHENIPWYTFIMKTIYTSFTLGFGGSGGVITPIFYVGATSGNLFGYLVEGYIPLFAAIGFVSVLAGTTNSPIASMIMAMELFGMDVAHYAAISIIIAFLMTGHRSVFPSQVLQMKKSEAINVKLGDEIINSETTYTTRFFRNIKKFISSLFFFNKTSKNKEINDNKKEDKNSSK